MLEKALFVTKLFLDGWEKLLLEDVFVSFSKLLSPKVDTAVGSGHHQSRACSGMAAGRCECICTSSKSNFSQPSKNSLVMNNVWPFPA